MSQRDVYSDYYWLTNLLLADAIAKSAGLNRGAAIDRCARRMRDRTTNQRLTVLARKIIAASPVVKVQMVVNLSADMIKDGLLNDY